MRAIELTNALVLDTETTGLDEAAEICEICILDAESERVVLNRLIRPGKPIPIEASALHGIYTRDVKKAPTWKKVLPLVRSILQDRHVIIYNLAFDFRMMRQSSAVHGLDHPPLPSATCAMRWYAEYWGEPRSHRDEHNPDAWKWQSLVAACRQQGIGVTGLHRALSDCRATLALVRHVNAKLAKEGAWEGQR